MGYFIRKLKQFAKVNILSLVIWTILSTAIPQAFPFFSSNSIPKDLTHQKIQLLIAHPDDEVMFFGPTISELIKPQYHNTISVTCFSTGNDQGLGNVRAQELERSLAILGIKQYEILNEEDKFKDSMSVEWGSNDIKQLISDDTDVVLTFDQFGVSNHSNHISLYKAVENLDKTVYALTSHTGIIKYSSTIVTNFQLLIKYINRLIPSINYDITEKEGTVFIFSDISSSVLNIAAMTNAHKSQMVWFRWGWIFTSRYLNANVLVKVN